MSVRRKKNPGDDRLRALERAARAGDAQAVLAYDIERWRRGIVVPPHRWVGIHAVWEYFGGVSVLGGLRVDSAISTPLGQMYTLAHVSAWRGGEMQPVSYGDGRRRVIHHLESLQAIGILDPSWSYVTISESPDVQAAVAGLVAKYAAGANPTRSNPDDRLRELERRAARGDREAAKALAREQDRRAPARPCGETRRARDGSWVSAGCDRPAAGLDPFSGTPLCEAHLAPCLKKTWPDDRPHYLRSNPRVPGGPRMESRGEGEGRRGHELGRAEALALIRELGRAAAERELDRIESMAPESEFDVGYVIGFRDAVHGKQKRRNPSRGDEQLRALERAAETGDPQAQAALQAARERLGLACVDCGGLATHDWQDEPHCLECIVGGMEHGHRHVHDHPDDCHAEAQRLDGSGADDVTCPYPVTEQDLLDEDDEDADDDE